MALLVSIIVVLIAAGEFGRRAQISGRMPPTAHLG
jgi:hypothetical protein